MNGKRPLFYTFILLLCLALVACSGFSTKNKGRDRGGDDGEDYDSIDKDGYQEPDLSLKDCGQYKSKLRSFRWCSDLAFGADNNPLRHLENCLLKSIDISIKPICDDEKRLKKELKEYQHDEEIAAEIEEDMEFLEITKYDYAETFYDFADTTDEIYENMADGVNDKITDVLSNRLIDMCFTQEISKKYGDIVARRILRLCGSNLRRSED